MSFQWPKLSILMTELRPSFCHIDPFSLEDLIKVIWYGSDPAVL